MAEETKNKENEDLIVEDLYKERVPRSRTARTKAGCCIISGRKSRIRAKERTRTGQRYFSRKGCSRKQQRKEKRKGSSLAVESWWGGTLYCCFFCAGSRHFLVCIHSKTVLNRFLPEHHGQRHGYFAEDSRRSKTDDQCRTEGICTFGKGQGHAG